MTAQPLLLDLFAGNGNKRQAWEEARQEMRERLSAWMEQQIVTECQPYQPVATMAVTETESE